VKKVAPRTAILGWGSLLWDGGDEFNRWHDDWRFDGPSLRLEFSRVSSSRLGALTLVVDPQNGAPTTVAWCLSKRKDPADAVADLRCREGCAVRYVACLDLCEAPDALPNFEGSANIAAWAAGRKLDAVIWTALPSNFASEVKRPFTVQEAVAYLKGLSAQAKVKAAEYIWCAPGFVRTPLRKAVEKEPWFTEVDAG
jgi:hypothetical protein